MQHPSTQLTPTAEQLNALELFLGGGSLAIQAGAGTGKTSTLRLLAESTKLHGQYIAFNKAIVVEAGSKMPGTVACNTAHSLAFREVGRKYAHRLQGGRMRSSDLARRLGLSDLWVTRQDQERKRLSAPYLAGLTMRTVTRFCQSADLVPDALKHAPYIDGIDVPPGAWENNEYVRRAIQPAVQRAWKDLQEEHGTLPYRHDHYLKQWQLSGPRIGADFILFDEAQDANPVMTAIVSAQKHAQLVWVGDSQQQIYSFTGAVNALAEVPADQQAFLTQSFRFGPAIADMANRCLEKLDAELRITGTPAISSVVCDFDDPDVVLTRTNATAVQTVLGGLQEGKRVHLVGGAKEIVSFAKAAETLMQGGRTDHPELACFDSWSEVRDYVEQDEQGGELRLLVKLVDDFTVPVILDALDSVTPEANADLIVSTAHKSKGREWSAVKLAGDFAPEPADEELRLLYVAVTRAKHRLDCSAIDFFKPADAKELKAPEPERKIEIAQVVGGNGDASAPVTAGEPEATPEPDGPADAGEGRAGGRPRATLTFTEPQLKHLLGTLRGRLEEYEAAVAEIEQGPHPNYDSADIGWYRERIEELRPLVQRVNDAGVRLQERTEARS